MLLPVIVCFTSAECVHCLLLRGMHGDLLPDYDEGDEAAAATKKEFHYWDSAFIGALITGSKNRLVGTVSRCGKPVVARVIDIHFQTNSAESISEASEFVLNTETGTIERISYNNNLLSLLLPSPQSLFPYVATYPSWIFVTGSEWNFAIRAQVGSGSPGSLHATLAGHDTIVTPGGGIDGTPQYTITTRRRLASSASEILEIAFHFCEETKPKPKPPDYTTNNLFFLLRLIRPVYDSGRLR